MVSHMADFGSVALGAMISANTVSICTDGQHTILKAKIPRGTPKSVADTNVAKSITASPSHLYGASGIIIKLSGIVDNSNSFFCRLHRVTTVCGGAVVFDRRRIPKMRPKEMSREMSREVQGMWRSRCRDFYPTLLLTCTTRC